MNPNPPSNLRRLLFVPSCLLLTIAASLAQVAPAPASDALAKIIGRVAAAETRTARDWAELGRETVTWGGRLQSEQQQIPEGPVRDALAAVDAGAKLDPKTAELRDAFAIALQLYREQQWTEADKAFQNCLKISKNDGPSIEFLTRIATFARTPPPKDWNGVWQTASK